MMYLFKCPGKYYKCQILDIMDIENGEPGKRCGREGIGQVDGIKYSCHNNVC